MITVASLVDYVIHNRRGKAFIGWLEHDIADSFVKAAQERLLIFSTDDDGMINGVAHGIKIGKIIFVSNILTTKPGVFKMIFRRFRELYPNIEIEAERRGKLYKYNTTKLASKLL